MPAATAAIGGPTLLTAELASIPRMTTAPGNLEDVTSPMIPIPNSVAVRSVSWAPGHAAGLAWTPNYGIWLSRKSKLFVIV